MIIASDIDPEMIEKAKKNAKKAGLAEDAIQWSVKPCQSYGVISDKLEVRS